MLCAIIGITFTCKFEKSSEIGVRSNDRLDVFTPSKGKTHNRLTCQTSEWGNPSSEVGFIAFEWGFCPISGVVNLVRT